jgi:hypothetical protein
MTWPPIILVHSSLQQHSRAPKSLESSVMSPRPKFFDRRSEDSTSSRTFSVDGEEPSPLPEKDLFFGDQDITPPRARRWWYWGKVVAAHVSPWILVLALSITLLQTRYNRRISAEDRLERYCETINLLIFLSPLRLTCRANTDSR